MTDGEVDGLSDENVVAQFRQTVNQGGVVQMPAGTLVGVLRIRGSDEGGA